ncbi:MAG: GH36-type glycosyl hydrolase domain-containing protein [Mangrovibacterium sp.]
MKKFLLFLSWLALYGGPVFSADRAADLSARIKNNPSIAYTKSRAVEIIRSGFNAGDGYREVWIRDYNTFIELASTVYPKDELKENLLVFFRMQGANGNIIDGFVPRDKTNVGYKFIYSDLEPRYAGHKNTVETDQETSLIQAVYKYIRSTGDQSILQEKIGGHTVAERMEMAADFLMKERFNKKYGLIWGATTADWGDVQPEHEWGVEIDENTHYAIDIYDNAMLLVALSNLMELVPEMKAKWETVRKDIAANCRKYLWNKKNNKFIPHIYLDGSPFPASFNESEIFYHGGTAVAIEAGLLSKDEIRISLEKMIANVKASGAATIGLTLYPPYPEGFFKNKGMYPYGYQNGGDWTWFGGRMILQLVRNGFIQEAYEQLCPMTDRVMKNKGFYEWYSVNNEPKGSGTFRGEAGVLFVAIEALEKAVQPK